ncbi:MAG: sigma-54 dependent transcriptional regulator, partial [Deltaproteobacteria bacterium]
MKPGDSQGSEEHARAADLAAADRPARERVRVLVVDSDPHAGHSVASALEVRGFAARETQDGDEAVRAATAGELDVILLDVRMPRVGGMDVLGRLLAGRVDVEVIVMTSQADVESAMAAVKAGAYDFVTRPFASNDAVALAVTKAAERRRLVHRTEALERELAVSLGYGHIVGASPRMREVFRLVEGVAASNATVLLVGDRGTGKELIARALHERSTRAARPLVTVNCGAMPADLVEGELFGHARGAFPGATTGREGLLELAHRGTLFLDEVSDLPLVAQGRLLRALLDGEVRRVGAADPHPFDVRVIAATHVDLGARVRDGHFREDLCALLGAVQIALPSLRERREDIPLLATHFVRQFAARTGKAATRISPDAMQELESHDWAGNVRELENAIERAVAVTSG